jgi:hypothetical protein
MTHGLGNFRPALSAKEPDLPLKAQLLHQSFKLRLIGSFSDDGALNERKRSL